MADLQVAARISVGVQMKRVPLVQMKSNSQSLDLGDTNKNML